MNKFLEIKWFSLGHALCHSNLVWMNLLAGNQSLIKLRGIDNDQTYNRYSWKSHLNSQFIWEKCYCCKFMLYCRCHGARIRTNRDFSISRENKALSKLISITVCIRSLVIDTNCIRRQTHKPAKSGDQDPNTDHITSWYRPHKGAPSAEQLQINSQSDFLHFSHSQTSPGLFRRQ